jgi:hypothetical protein
MRYLMPGINLRPVTIFNVAVYDGKKGWFHGFGQRTLTGKKGNLIEEVVGIIELEDGKIIQLSTNRFKFLDTKTLTDETAVDD